MNRRSLLTASLGLLFAGYTILSAQAPAPPPAKDYDLPLKGGHVIDAKNNLDAIRDVAIKDGKIAKVAVGIPADSAIKTVNVAGPVWSSVAFLSVMLTLACLYVWRTDF